MQGSMLIKVESSIIQTVFWGHQMLLYAIVVQEDLENLLLQICLQRITAKDAIHIVTFLGQTPRNTDKKDKTELKSL